MSVEAFGGDNAESYYDEGLTASVKGDLERAAQFFERAIRLDSTMATAYHQLGKCYARMGKHKQAVKLLSQVVQKRPKLIAARLDLGHALNGRGQFDAARSQFHAVLQAEPANIKALLGLADADFLEGNWTGALSYAQTAQASGGANFSVLFMLGKAAKLAGQPELSVRSLQKADKLLEKYLEANPDKPEGYFLRGEVAFVSEKYPDALQHYRDAEDRAQDGRAYLAYGESFSLADILAKQGLCLQRLGKQDRAREIGDRIAEIDPNHKLGKALREG